MARDRAGRHPDAVTTTLTDYVVDRRLAGDDGGAALRQCLRLAAADVTEFECDLPWTDDQTSDVRIAAAVLRRIARHPRRSPPATGVLGAGDPLVWDAFVLLAPYAYDGSVWTASGDGEPSVGFADANCSLWVRLAPEEVERWAAALAPDAVLVPAREWRARRRRGATSS